MKRIAFLIPATILAAALAFAQDTPSGSNAQNSTPSQSTNTPSNGQTMRGCLGGSTGSYTLTDSHTGTVYTLTGSTDNLSGKVGHEVEVTGQLAATVSSSASSTNNSGSNNSGTTNNSDTNSASGSSSSGSSTSTTNSSGSAVSNTIQVSNVTDVADHCSAGGSSS